MAISSITFIFIFLPVFILIYYLVPKGWWRNIILFLGSLFFFVWLDPNNIPLLLISAFLNYLFGLLIGLSIKTGKKRTQAAILTTVGVTGNLLVLGFYKYAVFFSATLQNFLKIEIPIPLISLPLGISFFTFTGVAYLLDVFHAVIPAEMNPVRFLNYMIMFPKILLGPITRYGQVQEDLSSQWFVNENFAEGVRRFIMGLGKKVILADNFALVSDKIFNSNFDSIGAGTAWFGLISYALQIFFDFAGYTDMAIGLGLMLGYHLPENFNFPYAAKSVTDFWRRWHVTLTAWFRSYVFTPLDFKWRRLGNIRRPMTILIVFLLTGLWHGAGWNFIIWGGYFGVFLSLEALGFERLLKKIPAAFQHLYTILVVWIGWVLFRLNDIGTWGVFFKALFGANGWMGEVNLRTLNVLLFASLLVIGLIFMTPALKRLENWVLSKGFSGKAFLGVFYTGIFALAICFILANGYVSFLYAKF